MKLSEPSLDNLINLISRLPGLGPKISQKDSAAFVKK
jgi:recombinational DNA repair protein RecR